MFNNPATPDLSERPALVIAETQATRLSSLAENALDNTPDVAGRLLDEIERARIVPDADLPNDVVAMGSDVDFRDEVGDRDHRVRLVYPTDADIDAHRISVMTPVGAALIGLSVGQAIDWQVQDGSTRRLRIVAVR